ncbi:MAG: hypothetical protein KAX30_09145, partial [Candidatus Atribacteria bacterium]|nr:hypothetical protein [Candidatus Atribacteria bacterium]
WKIGSRGEVRRYDLKDSKKGEKSCDAYQLSFLLSFWWGGLLKIIKRIGKYVRKTLFYSPFDKEQIAGLDENRKGYSGGFPGAIRAWNRR